MDDRDITDKLVNENLRNNIKDLREELGGIGNSLKDIFDEFSTEMNSVVESLKTEKAM